MQHPTAKGPLLQRLVRPRLPKIQIGWLELAFLILVLGAFGLRMWELDGRTMHYDEAIHVHFSWKLFKGEGFIHSPWMHGPFQIELTALIFHIFGDTDHTARLAYVLFGAALAGVPYFLRHHIGGAGSVLTGLMLALSPSLLYFSRFGRNDIMMAFWAASILVLMWRYFESGKARYLVFTSAVLALMFTTKETAYMVVVFFGAIAFLIALPGLTPWALGRLRFWDLGPPSMFVALLFTLTLPQWVAASGLFQDLFGLALTNRQGVEDGIVGAPHWAEPFISVPAYEFPLWLHILAALLVLGFLSWRNSRRVSIETPVETHSPDETLAGPTAWQGPRRVTIGSPALTLGPEVGAVTGSTLKSKVTRPMVRAWPYFREVLPGVAAPALSVTALAWVLFHPIAWYQLEIGNAPDFAVAGVLVALAVAILVVTRQTWGRSGLLLLVPPMLALPYLVLFTPLVDVSAVVGMVLPSGISVDASVNALPVNYLVAGVLLFGGLSVSVYCGLRLLGGVWLYCAGVFYLIWVTLYTTYFTNLAGIFSGSWLGMGYWVAQQDVARGNQPWYYYFVGLGVYELLPVVFGLAATVYFLRKGDVLGIVLALWTGLTLTAYTLASEKMPWLLVNVTLPFIFLAGKFLGELADWVTWRNILFRGRAALPVLAAAAIVVAVYQGYTYVHDASDTAAGPTLDNWVLLGSAALLALASAVVVRFSGPREGTALAGLGIAALLLGFGVLGALRASYTYDDSYKEVLVYAQGSSDLPPTFNELDSRVFDGAEDGDKVMVDYDMWYPFQWYVRNVQEDGLLSFSCFKSEGEDGWNTSCNPASDDTDSEAVLLTAPHIRPNASSLERFESDGPFRDLVWFPESYRRPNEDRPSEGFALGLRAFPNRKQLGLDIQYFKEVATSRKSWADGLAYLIHRRLDAEWYTSEFYRYLPGE